MTKITMQQVIDHKTTVVHSYPPNIEDIEKILPDCRKPGVIFTYGDTVYYPAGGVLPIELLTHEATHAVQQSVIGADLWWRTYLLEADFRYQQELEAHAFEYKMYASMHNRHERRRMLKLIAQKLSSELYGHVVKTKTAMDAIKNFPTE